MLTELCQELRNWFNVRDQHGNPVGYPGTYEITGGSITAPFLLPGQYFRITGSVLNEGVHKYADGGLEAETFTGTVWPLAIPKAVIKLSEDIDTWRKQYEAADSPAMSPYMSESFGGYSYSKGSAFSGSGSSSTSWRSVFAGRMNAWRKL